MSDSSTTPDEDQPLNSHGTAPRPQSDDPLREARSPLATADDDEPGDRIDLEDLP
ncbi:hypothetical protein [Microbacterium sp.]|uniref:hypothetical protein n=1 Tax=Microbacterium sp. TaxID=51671 RepID=UPI0028123357|nr:hypothetical protein [Microbacterium sp.]